MDLTFDPAAHSLEIPEGDSYSIISRQGELIWKGDADEFAALLNGLEWEQVSPTERRLVSQPMPVEDDGE